MRPSSLIVPIIAATLLAIGGGFGLWYVTKETEPPSLEITTPKLAMEPLASLQSKPLFFNFSAIPWIKDHWNEWGSAFGNQAPSPEELALQFEKTTQSPQEWRALDRKWHFGAVLLAGDPANFRPLLEHLRESRDWVLTRLDPFSLVFERSPANPWTIDDLTPTLAAFDTHSDQEKRDARVALARRLIFLGETTEAKILLDQVLKEEPKSAPAWTEKASMEAMVRKWPEALAASEQALKAKRHYRPALFIQANALLALGRPGEALIVTRMVYEEAPADPPTLFLHARATHAAHSFIEEIEVLQRMVGLLQGRSQPSGVWQIFLGQAYAATGSRALAEDQLKEALKDNTLTPPDREFAEKALERVASKGEMLNKVPSFPQSSLLDVREYHP